jgi:hypothetical protein
LFLTSSRKIDKIVVGVVNATVHSSGFGIFRKKIFESPALMSWAEKMKELEIKIGIMMVQDKTSVALAYLHENNNRSFDIAALRLEDSTLL